MALGHKRGVRRTAASLRNNLVDHLVEAMAITGRILRGPIPEWAREKASDV
jgi:hypothetical protein